MPFRIHARTVWCAALPLTLTIAACNQTRFSGQGNQGNGAQGGTNAPLNEVMPIPSQPGVIGGPGQIVIGGTGPMQIPNPIQVTGSTIDLLVDPGEGTPVVSPPPPAGAPLSIYFIMDITGSMRNHLIKVKDNLRTFTNELSAKGFDTRFGGLTFMDNIESKAPLGSAAAFISYLDATKSPGLLSGGKPNEASLLALSVAMDDVIAQETRPGAIMAFVLVTDNPGHKGNDAQPDCTVQDIAARLNAFPPDVQRRTRFFYSVPSNPLDGDFEGRECSGFKSAHAQMEALASQILLQNPPNERVGALQWKAGGLEQLNQLAGFIGGGGSAPIASDDICLTQDVRVASAGRTLFQWRAPDLNAIYRSLLARTSVRVPAALNESQFSGPNALPVEVSVDRCCMPRAEAAAGRVQACRRIATQVVSMSVIRNP